MIYACCDLNRRTAVGNSAGPLNGIDWLEVLDLDAPASSPRQRTLLVRLLKPVPAGLGRDNVRIDGGERVRNIRVEWAGAASDAVDLLANGLIDAAERDFLLAQPEPDRLFVVRTNSEGDFSTYHFALVRGEDDAAPPENLDPRLVEVDFSFKVECPTDFDCKTVRICPPPTEPGADIDYLAKDYAGFRRLMLDRISQLVPDWRDRTPADLGVALTELLAYAADHLSYWQDAVATEAYLGTARRRTSLRRHALLVDYRIGDGCNARTWLQLRVQGGPVPIVKDAVRFYTRTPGAPRRIATDSRDDAEARSQSPVVFEAMHDALLFEQHNDIEFHTWGDQRCCLPRGATRTTLRDPAGGDTRRLRLHRGDVLIFQEQVGPYTGLKEDADPHRRHAVRLTRVTPEAQLILDSDGRVIDRAPGPAVVDPLTAGTANEQAVVEIEWAAADALPFPLCLSARTDEAHGETYIEGISTALGNIVLVDHGATIAAESLGDVPGSRLQYPVERDAGHCEARMPDPLPPRYRPRLAHAPLTHAGTVQRVLIEGAATRSERVSFDPLAPAADALRWRMADVLPAVSLRTDDPATGPLWSARRDLLDSGGSARHFVIETAHDGSASLRFGDDAHGRRPDQRERFFAIYRVGNGLAGNVGAGAIAHVVSDNGAIESVVNPMAASGGTNPESAAQIRRRASQAFRRQERAVTPADYAAVTERHGGVQRAAARPRWTGSWHTMFVTVDRTGGALLDEPYTRTLSAHVERYRMAGHDLRFDDPEYVSLELELLVCVAPEYFRADVRAGLLDILGNTDLPDGRRGIFHPDNFSFGDTVYLSPVIAAARGVPGVASVQPLRFHRQGQPDPAPLGDGFMRLGRLEIPRLDNDRNFPEHGVLRLDLRGGK